MMFTKCKTHGNGNKCLHVLSHPYILMLVIFYSACKYLLWINQIQSKPWDTVHWPFFPHKPCTGYGIYYMEPDQDTTRTRENIYQTITLLQEMVNDLFCRQVSIHWKATWANRSSKVIKVNDSWDILQIWVSVESMN